MSIAERRRRIQRISPLQRLFAPIFRWFRAPSPHRRATGETIFNPSPLHAQTEDSSAKFWSVYNSEAERYDSALVESWKADMEGMLIFSGLFSASLTAFIIESYKNLVPDSGNMTVALLSQLSHQLSAQSNGSHFVVSSPPPFEVPTSSLVCNGLWFVSLGLSLTCALLATLVEQWARAFTHKTDRRPSPVRRARVFSFLYYGITRFGIHAIVDIIPLLLHIGLVLFFAGLTVFLLPINTLMAGIVASVLVVFMTLYLVITALPVVSLDCPYRTPLSSIFWRFVQYLSMLLNLPSTGHSLTDAVLTAAMQRRDIRDERAVLWTLESLTDNTELLPFVEATHEIIDGPAGLRRVDDHLFRLVLQTADAHTSLPRRILSLLWSAETLPSHDPLRMRRQIAGMRALWALGIVAPRISRAPASAVYGIDSASLEMLSIPASYRISLDAVIRYGHLKGIQARIEDIGTTFSVRDLSVLRDRRRLVRFLRTTVPGLAEDCEHLGSPVPELTALLERLGRLDSDHSGSTVDFDDARLHLEQLHNSREFSWASHFARIAVGLLGVAFREGLAPYRLLATCEEILPDVFTPQHRRLAESFLVGGPEPELPGSLHALLKERAHNDLDVIMRGALRLLPHLDPTNFVPIIHWYLADRAGGVNMQYVFAECNLDVLANAILEDLTSPRQFIHQATLRGIATLCLWSRDFTRILDCERVLGIIQSSGREYDSAYLTLKTILSTRILIGLRSKIIAGPTEANDAEGLRLQEVVAHPLLNEIIPEDEAFPPSQMETRDKLVHRLSDRYAAEYTALLSACTSPVQLPYKAAETIGHLLLEWHPFLTKTTSARTQLKIAQATLTLVKSACDTNPRRADIYAIVQSLFEDLNRDETLSQEFTDLHSTTLLAEAANMYHESADLNFKYLPTTPVRRRPERAFSITTDGPMQGHPRPQIHLSPTDNDQI